ncbi:SPFH domain-containing protein [Candidatus Micrarchaeota archaeon]|nr:SPFH domain-containing protein [Candidatus Micrarchaeota archaeon]
MVLFELAVIIILVLLFASIRILNQWEQGVILTLGKYSRTAGPGVNLLIPLIQQLISVDMRIRTLDIPKQEAMTKDNVPVAINAVVYFKVEKSEDAILKIQDYQYAVSQYAQTALRDVVGNSTLDEVLTDREKLAEQTRGIVDQETNTWGVDITSIKLQDIELPEDLKRIMSRQASAEREKRANITKSEGDKLAAVNLAEAAKIMEKNPAALQLRALQTIDGLGPSPSNTVVLFPMELLELVKSWTGAGKKEKKD